MGGRTRTIIMPSGVYIRTEETRKRIGDAVRGRVLSLETRKKLSEIHKNRGTGKWMTGRFGENANQWKGENAGYRAKHLWIERRLGKPDKCEHCEKTGMTGHKIQWANKSRKYKIEISDWIRLCVPCHVKFDGKRGYKTKTKS